MHSHESITPQPQQQDTRTSNSNSNGSSTNNRESKFGMRTTSLQAMHAARPASLEPANLHSALSCPPLPASGRDNATSSSVNSSATTPARLPGSPTASSPSSPTRRLKVHSPYAHGNVILTTEEPFPCPPTTGGGNVMRHLSSPLGRTPHSTHSTHNSSSNSMHYVLSQHSGGTPTGGMAEFPTYIPPSSPGGVRRASTTVPSTATATNGSDYLAVSFNSAVSGSQSLNPTHGSTSGANSCCLSPTTTTGAAGSGADPSTNMSTNGNASVNYGSTANYGSKDNNGTSRRTKNICRHFLEGKCNRGSACRFYHPGSKHKVVAATHPRTPTNKPITPLADLERQREDDAAALAEAEAAVAKATATPPLQQQQQQLTPMLLAVTTYACSPTAATSCNSPGFPSPLLAHSPRTTPPLTKPVTVTVGSPLSAHLCHSPLLHQHQQQSHGLSPLRPNNMNGASTSAPYVAVTPTLSSPSTGTNRATVVASPLTPNTAIPTVATSLTASSPISPSYRLYSHPTATVAAMAVTTPVTRAAPVHPPMLELPATEYTTAKVNRRNPHTNVGDGNEADAVTPPPYGTSNTSSSSGGGRSGMLSRPSSSTAQDETQVRRSL